MIVLRKNGPQGRKRETGKSEKPEKKVIIRCLE